MAAVVHDRSGSGPKKPELLGALEIPLPQLFAVKTDWLFLSLPCVLMEQAAAFARFVAAAAAVVGWQLVVCLASEAAGSESGAASVASDAAEALSCALAMGSWCERAGSEQRRRAGWRGDEGWAGTRDRCRSKDRRILRNMGRRRRTELQGCWQGWMEASTSGSAEENKTRDGYSQIQTSQKKPI